MSAPNTRDLINQKLAAQRQKLADKKQQVAAPQQGLQSRLQSTAQLTEQTMPQRSQANLQSNIGMVSNVKLPEQSVIPQKSLLNVQANSMAQLQQPTVISQQQNAQQLNKNMGMVSGILNIQPQKPNSEMNEYAPQMGQFAAELSDLSVVESRVQSYSSPAIESIQSNGLLDHIEQQVATQTKQQIDFCQSLLAKQLETSKMLLERKDHYTSLAPARSLLTQQHFQPLETKNLRPRSAESGRELFTFNGRSSSNEVRFQPVQNVQNQMNYQPVLKKRVQTVKENVEIYRLMKQKNVQAILAEQIQQDPELADKVFSCLKEVEKEVEHKQLFLEESLQLRKGLVYEFGSKMIHFANKSDFCEISYYDSRNLEYEFKIPFVVVGAVEIDGIVYAAAESGQVLRLKHNSSYFQIVYSAKQRIAQISSFNHFLTGAGHTQVIIILLNSGFVHVYDLQTQQTFKVKLKPYSDSINVQIFTNFSVLDESIDFLVVGTQNGFVTVIDKQQFVFASKQNQAYEINTRNGTMSQFQVLQTVKELKIFNGKCFVSDYSGMMKCYLLVKGQIEAPLVGFELLFTQSFDQAMTFMTYQEDLYAVGGNNAYKLIALQFEKVGQIQGEWQKIGNIIGKVDNDSVSIM
ncbi:Conserved_hypothetical protein [Hexamita inflata]|uniref:Uncharacterized protein n=1 Tax=Hexamita inflata TaxID=28002 RepID=A0AA86V491_9EUKA|nr:Conserved hypothetical protein [Hexamita inflata]